MTTRGSYILEYMVKFSGASRKVSDKMIHTGLLEFIKVIQDFFFLTIYQNYTLAFISVH